MAKFRKKPVVIEAVQFDGREFGEYANFMPKEAYFFMPKEAYFFMSGNGKTNAAHINIHTLEGTMRADIGDWIIKGVKGEFYPCKPDIFEATYEPE